MNEFTGQKLHKYKVFQLRDLPSTDKIIVLCNLSTYTPGSKGSKANKNKGTKVQRQQKKNSFYSVLLKSLNQIV